jgi:hypothetical protein
MSRRYLVALALVAVTSAMGTAASAQSQGFTSAVHKSNAGGIVFSQSEIPFRTENPSTFSNGFAASDSLCGRVYLDRPLRETPLHLPSQGGGQIASLGMFEVRAKVAGGQTFLATGQLDIESAAVWTTFRLNLNPVGCDAEGDYPKGWAKFVRSLAPGTHEIEIQVYGQLGAYYTAEPVARGTITLTRAPGEDPSSVSIPKDAWTGKGRAKVEKDIRSALLKTDLASGPKDIVQVVITSSDWTEGRFEVTRQPYRKVTATILFADSNADGACRYTSYNFLSKGKRTGWTPLGFDSFCLNCADGEMTCK